MSHPLSRHYRIGDVVSDALILSEFERPVPAWRESMPLSHRLMFRVRCVQCGFERDIGYRALTDRERHRRTGCAECQGLEARAKTRRKDERITDPALAVALGAWR